MPIEGAIHLRSHSIPLTCTKLSSSPLQSFLHLLFEQFDLEGRSEVPLQRLLDGLREFDGLPPLHQLRYILRVSDNDGKAYYGMGVDLKRSCE